jgi:pilus assembly protein Flp/PilA
MVTLICSVVARLRRGESAQGMAEYALLAALIAVAAIGAITLLGNEITDVFNSVGNDLANAS